MRKGWLVVLALLLCLPAISDSQSINYYPAGGLSTLTGTPTATTSTVPILLPDGSVSAPSLARSSQTNTGIYFLSSPSIGFAFAGGLQALVVSGGVFRSNVLTGQFDVAGDTILMREGAATWQAGNDTATAVAQTFKGADSTGSGIAGGSLTLRAGAGTSGNADGGNLVLAGGALAGSGEYGVVTISDLGTKPTCDAALRGGFWYDAGGAGVADTFEVCRKDAADAYAWVSVY